MRVSIIIPNYNSRENLPKNLPYVLKAGADEVIVVDDASTDGSQKNVKCQMANGKSKVLRLIENKKNLGFSSTVNRGVKEATGDIVVLLNTDVTPEPGFLGPLVAHFSDPKVFAVGCMDSGLHGQKF